MTEAKHGDPAAVTNKQCMVVTANRQWIKVIHN